MNASLCVLSGYSILERGMAKMFIFLGDFFVGLIFIVCRKCLWLLVLGGGAMPRVL